MLSFHVYVEYEVTYVSKVMIKKYGYGYSGSMTFPAHPSNLNPDFNTQCQLAVSAVSESRKNNKLPSGVYAVGATAAIKILSLKVNGQVVPFAAIDEYLSWWPNARLSY
jgi:hypothetical protein